MRAESPRVSCSLAAPRAASRQPRYRLISSAFLPFAFQPLRNASFSLFLARSLSLRVSFPRSSRLLRLRSHRSLDVPRLNHRADRRSTVYRGDDRSRAFLFRDERSRTRPGIRHFNTNSPTTAAGRPWRRRFTFDRRPMIDGCRCRGTGPADSNRWFVIIRRDPFNGH